MTQKLKLLGLIAGMTFVGAMTASAAVIDFTALPSTASGTLLPSIAGTTAGLGWGVVSDPAGKLTLRNYDGGKTGGVPTPAFNGSPLAFNNDGIGVTDDEITSTVRKVESVTVTFSRAVRVTGFYFLDLFLATDVRNNEYALIADQDGMNIATENAIEPFGKPAAGYKFAKYRGDKVSALTFTAGLGNDEVGSADYALAGIKFAPIPLPAGGLLLLSGMGALAAARRRKQA